jgi:hypothetical protein
MMEAIVSSETSVPILSTRRNIAEDGILQFIVSFVNYVTKFSVTRMGRASVLNGCGEKDLE